MQSLAQLQEQRLSSIERSRVKHTNNSIDLPDEIDSLIDNKMYRNKFRKLIREGHLAHLLKLAEIAKTKETPSRWFAMVTAKRNWERTLEFLAKVRQVANQVAHAAQQLAVPAERMKPLFKAAWTLRGQLPRLAGLAKETGRDPERYFWWLYARQLACGTEPGRG
jgi:hypothetical protein